MNQIDDPSQIDDLSEVKAARANECMLHKCTYNYHIYIITENEDIHVQRHIHVQRYIHVHPKNVSLGLSPEFGLSVNSLLIACLGHLGCSPARVHACPEQ